VCRQPPTGWSRYQRISKQSTLFLRLMGLSAACLAQGKDESGSLLEASDAVREFLIADMDKGGMLTGVLFLQDLLVHDPDIHVADIMERDAVHFRTDDDIQEVAHAFERYALVSVPVVNAHGQLVGRLTVDPVMEVAVDAAQEDMLAQVGLQREEDLFANVWRAARNRWPWLLINLTTAFMASRVSASLKAPSRRS
jgi:Mg/Co/Ni transporter MgtE